MLVAQSRRSPTLMKQQRLFTVEHAAYVGLALLSVLLHMLFLGDRALHHDETIHAYYSWRIYAGEGYIHDPLTHGPFLYYWTAFQYMLFGDSEFTARLSAALFGIILSLSPWLLRSEMGRGAALLAAAYLVISPVVLYVGRFIRHDIFATTWEILCLAAILRYVATRHVRWLYVLWASLGLMYSTIETSYIFTLILGTFLLFVTLWLVDRRLLIALAVFAVLAAATLKLLPAHQGLVVQSTGNTEACEPVAGGVPCGYAPVLSAEGNQRYVDFPLVTEQQALSVRHNGADVLFGEQGYLATLNATLFGSENQVIHSIKGQTVFGQNGVFLHPSITTLTLLSLAFLLSMIVLIWFWRFGEAKETLWQRAVAGAQPRTLLPALDTLKSKHHFLAMSLGILIYVAFFTSFGKHSSGIVSGLTGSLLYWVGQHDVQRGGQPQHYYFVQLLVYEPLLLTFGIGSMFAGVGYLAWKLWRRVPLTAKTLAPGLLGWWAGGCVVMYTWAGEKMPWITLHVAAPLAFIAAWGTWMIIRWAFTRPIAGTLLQRLPAPNRREARQALGWYLGLVVVVAVFATILLSRMIRVDAAQPNGNPATPLLLAATVGLILLLTVGYGVWHGWRRSIGALVIVTWLIWGTYSFRSAWRLNYHNGDVPVEMMVYVQSSPDVTRVMQDLHTLSIAETGRNQLPILYDNEQIWDWYMRNYEQGREFNVNMNGAPGEEIAVVLMLHDNLNANQAYVDQYVSGRFPLRWWFPENEFYRFATQPMLNEQGQPLYDTAGNQRLQAAPFDQDSTIGRLIRNPLDAQTQNELWRYLLFRQPPAGLGSVDFYVFTKPQYAFIFGLAAPETTVDPLVR